MKRIALILAFSVLATVAVAAQDKPKTDAAKPEAKPAETLPTVDEILDRFVKAIGGKEAVEKITSRAMKGSFDIEAMNMNGTFEMYAKAPNKSAMKIDLPGFGVVNNVFDGSTAWSADPTQGLRELSGPELAQTKRRSDFYEDLNLKKHYTKMEVKGKQKVGSYDTYMIEATPAEGSPEKLYFDTATGFLVRQDSETDGPQGKMQIESYMDDYKAVDGVKIPHTMKQVLPMFAFTTKVTEVKTNVPIDDAKFAKPAN
jgi:hypothetical protein